MSGAYTSLSDRLPALWGKPGVVGRSVPPASCLVRRSLGPSDEQIHDVFESLADAVGPSLERDRHSHPQANAASQ